MSCGKLCGTDLALMQAGVRSLASMELHQFTPVEEFSLDR